MAQAQDPAQGKHPLRTYQPSGAVGAMALPLGLLYGALAATICGSLYQLLVEALPVRWVSPLITMLLGYFVGFFTAVGLRQGKLRNTQVAVVVLLAAAGAALAVTYWTSYVRFLHFLDERAPEFVADAGTFPFREWLRVKVHMGWSVGSHPNKSPLSGPVVYLVWAAEALTLVGVAVGAGLYVLDRPFCERSGTWMQGRALPERTDGSAAQILAAAAAGDLETLVTRRDRGTDTLTYTLYQGPDGQGPAYLSIAHVVVGKKSDGSSSRRTTELVRLAVLSDIRREQLLAAPEPAPAPAPAPMPAGAG